MSQLKKINKDAVKSVSRIESVTVLSDEQMAKVVGGQTSSTCTTYTIGKCSGQVLTSQTYNCDYPRNEYQYVDDCKNLA